MTTYILLYKIRETLGKQSEFLIVVPPADGHVELPSHAIRMHKIIVHGTGNGIVTVFAAVHEIEEQDGIGIIIRCGRYARAVQFHRKPPFSRALQGRLLLS